jgi:hypothetical protein
MSDDIDYIGAKLPPGSEIAAKWSSNPDAVRRDLLFDLLMRAEASLGLPLRLANGPLVPRINDILAAASMRRKFSKSFYACLCGIRDWLAQHPELEKMK